MNVMIEAKKIRKQHPRKFKTWNEYVAYASKLVSKKSKAKRPAVHKHKTIKKAVMPKKVVARKSKMGNAPNELTSELNQTLNRLNHSEEELKNLKHYYNKKDPDVKKRDIIEMQKYITFLKSHIRELKKLI